MDKKDYLIGALIDSAQTIANTAKTASVDELADELIDYMAIVSLLGESGFIAPRSPQQAEFGIMEKQNELTEKFVGDWNNQATD
jgi:NTP pyrophosphatase (non-canonical NTP hydrolase)